MPIFNTAKQDFLNKAFNIINERVMIALLKESHNTDMEAQQFWADVMADECSGIGYSSGGKPLEGMKITADDKNNRGVLDAEDVQWENSTITARYIVIYRDTGDPASSPIISINDIGSEQSSTANTFALQWDGSGILNLN